MASNLYTVQRLAGSEWLDVYHGPSAEEALGWITRERRRGVTLRIWRGDRIITEGEIDGQ